MRSTPAQKSAAAFHPFSKVAINGETTDSVSSPATTGRSIALNLLLPSGETRFSTARMTQSAATGADTSASVAA